jgi:adenylylsulfate kinase
LSTTGKSTVAREVVRQLRRRRQLRPILLDGDEIRAALDMTGGYDLRSRMKMSLIYARLCALLARKGHLVVIATISLFHEVQRWNQRHQDNYLEVLLDVPLAELKERDTKGLYTDNDGQDTVGVGQPAEYPQNPDLVIRNYGDTDPESAAKMILDSCEEKGLIDSD